jgi:hypothetical protein
LSILNGSSMPHTCRSQYSSGSAQLGGLFRTFVGTRSGDKVAPSAAIRWSGVFGGLDPGSVCKRPFQIRSTARMRRPRFSPLLGVYRLGDCRNLPINWLPNLRTPFLADVDVLDVTRAWRIRGLTPASPRRMAHGPQKVMRGSPISPLVAWLKPARTGSMSRFRGNNMISPASCSCNPENRIVSSASCVPTC